MIDTCLLVVCPKCAKVYHVDPAELPPAKMVDRKKKGKGWFLSCQYCFHEWLYISPVGFTWYEGSPPPMNYGKTLVQSKAKFLDYTNLDSLKSNALSAEQQKRIYQNQLMSESYSPFYDIPEEDNSSEYIEKIKEKVTTSYFYKASLFFISSIILTSGFFFFQPEKIESVSSFIREGVELNVPDTQKFFLQMKIDNIKFERERKDEKIFVKVSGTILNPLQTVEILPPLKLSIWGACDQNSLANNLSTGKPYCLIKEWEHVFDDPAVKPGETRCIESNIVISDDIEPLKVDVNF